ncbi:MAG: lipoate protein ligase C-terminal domain-containing protein [Candidatus Verstraetearchaeota archaeon]|nr:lipoate protein ligase C-terminal domain-containing protein [Candidatus Verstraetearchaeota archaeon]
MERSVARKFRDGKMVKVWVKSDGGSIKEIRITGDFFAHPEEGIELIERELRDVKIVEVRRALESASGGITLIGVSIEDLIDMIEECLE